MLKIYGAPPSPPVNRVRFTANYLELDYEFVQINLLEGEHRSEWYAKLHPAGKVPAIEDDGTPMFESIAICRYLARKAASPIYPSDVSAAAAVDQWADFASNHIGLAMGKVLFNKLFAPLIGGNVDENSMAEGYQFLARFLPIVEAQFAAHAHVAGPDFSLADIILLATIDPAEVIELDLTPYPKLSAWRADLQAQPFYQACYPSYGEMMQQLMAGG
jgi:glutathione S-transferase